MFALSSRVVSHAKVHLELLLNVQFYFGDIPKPPQKSLLPPQKKEIVTTVLILIVHNESLKRVFFTVHFGKLNLIDSNLMNYS